MEVWSPGKNVFFPHLKCDVCGTGSDVSTYYKQLCETHAEGKKNEPRLVFKTPPKKEINLVGWKAYDDETPKETLLLAKDRENGDVYVGQFEKDLFFSGLNVEVDCACLLPSERFYYRVISRRFIKVSRSND